MTTTFKINDYLELKLEDDKTNIYVNEELFRHCKYLLLNIPVDEVPDYDEIGSIDEVAEYLDDSLEEEEISWLKPEVEFFGHCSNLQAWYENDYDSCILHSNISFPLLKELGKYNSRASHRFDEELVKRLDSGYKPVQEYLFIKYSNYILNLPEEKAINIEFDKLSFQSLKALGRYDSRAMNLFHDELLEKLNSKNRPVKNSLSNKYLSDMLTLPKEKFDSINIKFNKIKEANLDYSNLNKLPEWISKFKNLQGLFLNNNNLSELPESIGELKKLQKLFSRDNSLRVLPESIGELKNLQKLFLSNNNLSVLPESIGGLKNLTNLDLSNNYLNELPESIMNLKSLGGLYLENNKLTVLPESINRLNNLKVLTLRRNPLSEKSRRMIKELRRTHDTRENFIYIET